MSPMSPDTREPCPSSMQPRFTTHARPAASSTTTSSAVLPDGNASVTVRSQSGLGLGARFW